jgi:3-hydroxymyristoyl/3-hydroxydecanoyl-(acyl carrier protein) dehydratase
MAAKRRLNRIREILEALLTSLPFLMVDRIISIHGDMRGIGQERHRERAAISGHFPNNPVMPGCWCWSAWRRQPGCSAFDPARAKQAKACLLSHDR